MTNKPDSPGVHIPPPLLYLVINEVRDQLRVGFDIRVATITLYEERPYFRNPKRIVKHQTNPT